MKLKKILLFNILCFSFIAKTYAVNDEIVAETTKYYKTTDNTSYIGVAITDEFFSKTEEISKSEYNNAMIETYNGSVETTYKKMTSYIIYSNGHYKYKVNLTWKNMPKIRSYDIIAIGYYKSVKAENYSAHVDYCTSNKCYKNTTGTFKNNSSGTGFSFKLPSGNLSSLNVTLELEIYKNISDTIIKQIASGSYSHSTQNINSSIAKNYEIDTSGIDNLNYGKYFDSISPAVSTWTGEW